MTFVVDNHNTVTADYMQVATQTEAQQLAIANMANHRLKWPLIYQQFALVKLHYINSVDIGRNMMQYHTII